MTYIGRKHGSKYIRQLLFKAQVYVYTNIIRECNMYAYRNIHYIPYLLQIVQIIFKINLQPNNIYTVNILV